MAKLKLEPVYIGIDDQVIELTGKELEEFNKVRESMQLKDAENKTKQETEKALKISAYTKLGLTDEEINAIL
jgi:hypothetical protein